MRSTVGYRAEKGPLAWRGGCGMLSWGVRRDSSVPSGDSTANLPDLGDVVNAIWRFRISVSDEGVQMAAEGGGGEGLMAEWTVAVFRDSRSSSAGVRRGI